VQAQAGLEEHPEWYEGSGVAALFDALVHGPSPENPLDAAPDDDSRTMLAEVLASQVDPTTASQMQARSEPMSAVAQIAGALQSLAIRYLERRQRELRGSIAEAERRGDTAMVETLTLEKMKVDRMLREL
jgi:DNA primase